MSTKVTYSQITGTPSLSVVATSGSYADLTNKPALFSGAYADLSGKPSLATVANSGSYADLSGKPSLATVATSGSYADLTNKPTFPSLVAQISSGVIPSGTYQTNLNFTMSGNVGSALQTITGIPYYVWYTGQSSICTFLTFPSGSSPQAVGNIVMGGSAPGTPQNVTVLWQWQRLDDSNLLCAWPYSFTLNIWA